MYVPQTGGSNWRFYTHPIRGTFKIFLAGSRSPGFVPHLQCDDAPPGEGVLRTPRP